MKAGSKLLAVCLVSSWVCCGACACYAHPFHISTAELEFNAETNCFEVSLRLHVQDLEKALAIAAGKRVDAQQDGFEAAVKKYLDRHCYVTSLESMERARALVDEGSKQPVPEVRSTIRMVGHESEGTWLWLYFEMMLPRDGRLAARNDLVLVNTVLFDLVPDQINTMSVRSETGRTAMRMTGKSPWSRLSPTILKQSGAQ